MTKIRIRNLQAMGLNSSHLVTLAASMQLSLKTADALRRLQARGRAAGFDLTIASAHRSYQRQLLIFNNKAVGLRVVSDEEGAALSRGNLSELDWLHTILRYSALPGTSRHHWGSDIDIFDRAAVDPDCAVQLLPREYQSSGPFSAMSAWLTDLMALDDAEGFFRPYAMDGGGVAPELWHLSYRPEATLMVDALDEHLLAAAWNNQLRGFDVEPLALVSLIEAQLPSIRSRYWSLD